MILSRSAHAIVWYENRLAGDTDDDGEVGFSDLLVLSTNYGKTDATWQEGDFNGDSVVTFADFLILSANFA